MVQKITSLGDIYVNDAFELRTERTLQLLCAQFFKDAKCFRLFVAKEIESIEKVLKIQKNQWFAILGGSKSFFKITVIENILDKVNHMIIGGGMTFTFHQSIRWENWKFDL